MLVTEQVLVEKSDKLLILTLNRPDKKNALTRAMYKTLATEIVNADGDPDVRCILIKAKGDRFTAGNDLADFAAIGNSTAAPKPEDANPLLPALAKARTQIVAAVKGRAVGVGVTMLLHCDMVYVAEDAFLITPFVNLALVPEAGSSMLMPLRIGHARAFEMFVLGEPVSAEKAVNWGIANRAVPTADLHSVARAAATAIAAARAPECKSAVGTARFAMPQLTAFSALTGSPKTNISNARACPMRSGISMLEPASGTSARLTNGVIRNASSATYTMSQCRSIVTPTPTARPLTAATIGVRALASAGRSGLASSGLGAAVELPIAAKSARSFPAVNISPLALINMQRTSRSPSAFAISVASVLYIARVSAFFLSGRLRVNIKSLSDFSTSTCSVTRILLRVF